MSRKKIKGACEKHNIMYPTTRAGSEYKHKGRLVNEVLNNKKLTYQVFAYLSSSGLASELDKMGWEKLANRNGRPTLLHYDMHKDTMYEEPDKKVQRELRADFRKLKRYKASLIKSKLNGTGSYGRKGNLWANITPNLRKHMKKSIVIEDIKHLNNVKKLKLPIIIKPSDGGGGDDITVIDKYSDARAVIETVLAGTYKVIGRAYASAILSEYILNPMLHKGKKFHFRIHWILAIQGGKKPVYKAWLHNKGRVYTAKNTYRQTDWGNHDIHDSHLKSTTGVILAENMRNFDLMFVQMCKIMKEIHCIAKKTRTLPYSESKYGYLVHGIDFMVETINNKPFVWLLEVNDRPGLNRKNRAMSKSMLHGIAVIVNAMATGKFKSLTQIPDFCQT
jgi:hypothetical protein